MPVGSMGAARQMEQAPFKFQPGLVWLLCRLGRPAPLPWKIRLLSNLVRMIVPPQRRARVDQVTGYVLLEPARG